MSPLQIIEKAASLGVSLHLTDKHTVRFKGEGKFINGLMPLLQANKAQIIRWLEFCDLYDYLAPKSKWTALDHQEWCKDLEMQPELTIECLMALRYSWSNDRFGCLTPVDWLREELKIIR